jgi:hypothetical protein
VSPLFFSHSKRQNPNGSHGEIPHPHGIVLGTGPAVGPLILYYRPFLWSLSSNGFGPLLGLMKLCYRASLWIWKLYLWTCPILFLDMGNPVLGYGQSSLGTWAILSWDMGDPLFGHGELYLWTCLILS